MTARNLLKESLTGALSLLKGLKVTLVNLFRRKVTLQYPEEYPKVPPRFRGLHGLTVDPETGDDNCIGCQACARICPDRLITLELEKREGHKGRYPARFEIDLNACCFCGLCTEACPTPMKSLVMTREFELASADRRKLVLTKEQMYENAARESARRAREEPARPDTSPEQANESGS